MKNLFSKKLFIEALRQIRTPFALLFTLIAGGTGFITITTLISAIYQYKLEHVVSFVYVSDMVCLMPITFAIAVPLFTFKLFKFLTKRNASDFYHAIPLKRNCIMFTYITTIVTATFVIILVSTLIPTIVFGLSQKYISFNFYEVYPFALNTLACSLLTMSICILASSMTGTLFTAILFTLAIMFGPRIIIFSITATISDTLGDLITYDYDFGIFNSDVNLMFSSALSFIEWTDTDIYKLSFSFVYTLILSIIYLVIGFIAFNKRQSEQAENTGKNPFAQHSMRIALGYFFFHMAVTNSYFYCSDFDIDLDFIFETSMLILIGIAAMIIFEVITTKKAKNIKNCIFSIPVAAVLCFATYLIITIISNNILNYKPDADDIDSIQYITYSKHYDDFDARYFEKKAAEVKITNPEILKLVTDLYSEELKVFKDNYNKKAYYFDLSEIMNKENRVKICFNDSFSSELRYIYFDNEEKALFDSLLNEDEKYSSVYHSLPKDFEATYSAPKLQPDEIKIIIDTLKSEYKDLPVYVLSKCFGDYYSSFTEICSISCATVENSTKYYFSINITPELPKTYEAFLEIMDNRTKNNNEAHNYTLELLENIEDYFSDASHASVYAEIYDLETHKRLTNVSFNSYTKQDIENECYEYGYNDYDEFKNNFTNFITNTTNLSDAKYIVFITSESYSEDDEYKTHDTVFFSNNADFVNKIATYNKYAY